MSEFVNKFNKLVEEVKHLKYVESQFKVLRESLFDQMDELRQEMQSVLSDFKGEIKGENELLYESIRDEIEGLRDSLTFESLEVSEYNTLTNEDLRDELMSILSEDRGIFLNQREVIKRMDSFLAGKEFPSSGWYPIYKDIRKGL